MTVIMTKSVSCKFTRNLLFENYVNLSMFQIIDQLRYIKIQSKTNIDLSMRSWGIATKFVVIIPQSLVLRSIVVG